VQERRQEIRHSLARFHLRYFHFLPRSSSGIFVLMGVLCSTGTCATTGCCLSHRPPLSETGARFQKHHHYAVNLWPRAEARTLVVAGRARFAALAALGYQAVRTGTDNAKNSVGVGLCLLQRSPVARPLFYKWYSAFNIFRFFLIKYIWFLVHTFLINHVLTYKFKKTYVCIIRCRMTR
jgi:hypothetical protein